MNARAAHRALLRHRELLFFLAVLHHFQHVRNHFARPLHQHRVARVHVPAARTSSILCSVDFATVTPPICTGSNTANGVSTPVRPTLTSIYFNSVVS